MLSVKSDKSWEYRQKAMVYFNQYYCYGKWVKLEVL